MPSRFMGVLPAHSRIVNVIVKGASTPAQATSIVISARR